MFKSIIPYKPLVQNFVLFYFTSVLFFYIAEYISGIALGLGSNFFELFLVDVFFDLVDGCVSLVISIGISQS
jgi:uncharacterized membrane protein